MYGLFTYIYHKSKPNVGKYTIHWAFGLSSFHETHKSLTGEVETLNHPGEQRSQLPWTGLIMNTLCSKPCKMVSLGTIYLDHRVMNSTFIALNSSGNHPNSSKPRIIISVLDHPNVVFCGVHLPWCFLVVTIVKPPRLLQVHPYSIQPWPCCDLLGLQTWTFKRRVSELLHDLAEMMGGESGDVDTPGIPNFRPKFRRNSTKHIKLVGWGSFWYVPGVWCRIFRDWEVLEAVLLAVSYK